MGWVTFLAVLVAAGAAHGHGMRTAYLELVQGAGGAALATWRTKMRWGSTSSRTRARSSVNATGISRGVSYRLSRLRA